MEPHTVLRRLDAPCEECRCPRPRFRPSCITRLYATGLLRSAACLNVRARYPRRRRRRRMHPVRIFGFVRAPGPPSS